MDVFIRLIGRALEDWKLDAYMVNGLKSLSHLIYFDVVLIITKVNSKSLSATCHQRSAVRFLCIFQGWRSTRKRATFSSLINLWTFITSSMECHDSLLRPSPGLLGNTNFREKEVWIVLQKKKCGSISQANLVYGWHSLKMERQMSILWRKTSSLSTRFFQDCFLTGSMELLIPAGVVTKVWQTAYRFIWEGRYSLLW